MPDRGYNSKKQRKELAVERNICKFNFNTSSDLICDRFVYETNLSQSESKVCKTHLLGLVTEGEGLLCKTCGNLPLSAGMLFVIERGERFSITGHSDLAYIYIGFSGRRSDELIQRIGYSAAQCLYDSSDALTAFWQDCLQRAEDHNVDLLAEAVVLYTMAQLSAASKPQNDLMTKIVSTIGEQFTNADFSLNTLAKQLGYDAKYLSAFFKKKKGMAFTAYLRDLRIRHAIFMMEQGVVSVKNVALLSGFGDTLYFSRVFKECEGLSPKAYLMRLWGKDS